MPAAAAAQLWYRCMPCRVQHGVLLSALYHGVCCVTVTFPNWRLWCAGLSATYIIHVLAWAVVDFVYHAAAGACS
jgi:hypothetical protein